jgi:hypothetical protein
MADIPIELDEIEQLMQKRSRNGNGHATRTGTNGRIGGRLDRAATRRIATVPA